MEKFVPTLEIDSYMRLLDHPLKPWLEIKSIRFDCIKSIVPRGNNVCVRSSKKSSCTEQLAPCTTECTMHPLPKCHDQVGNLPDADRMRVHARNWASFYLQKRPLRVGNISSALRQARRAPRLNRRRRANHAEKSNTLVDTSSLVVQNMDIHD